jgi:hypothetical protein
MAPLCGEDEGFYVSQGIAVWASEGAGSERFEGVVIGPPKDQLGVWVVRKVSDKSEVLVPWKQLSPRAMFAPASPAPTPATAPAPAPSASGGGGGCPNNNPKCQNPTCRNPNCGVGKKGGKKGDKKKGAPASGAGPAKGKGKGKGKEKGKSAAPASKLAPSAVEPVDAFLEVLSKAAADTLGQAAGIDAAALAAADAAAAAELRPWLKMSLRSFKNSAVAAAAQSGGNTLARGGLARPMV